MIQGGYKPKFDKNKELNIEALVPCAFARNANVIVFGGPPNWQNQVKSKAPNYVCVSVDGNTFDKKKIQKADAIVIKTDYLSHKQWHQMVDQAKKFGRKIVYCRNNISLLFMQIEKAMN